MGGGTRLGYRPALDGVRALAVLAVVAVHSWSTALPNGWLGVDVFFVLSGFLITSLLVDEWSSRGTVDLAGFYMRRARRLLPALLLAGLGALLLAGLIQGEAAETRRELGAALVFGANWQVGAVIDHGGWAGLLGHTWSLSVEEQFYLVWPLLLVLALRLVRVRGALALTLAGIGLVAAHRAVSWGGMPDVFYRTDMRADSLLVGCAIGLAAASGWRPSPRWAGRMGIVSSLGLLALAAFPAALHTSPFMALGGFTLLGLLGGGLVCAAFWNPHRLLRWPPLVYVGRISYGVYLWDYPVSRAVDQALGSGPASLVATLAITLALAAASHRYAERPLIRRLRSWDRASAPRAVVPAAP